jgi:hypothetical protein
MRAMRGRDTRRLRRLLTFLGSAAILVPAAARAQAKGHHWVVDAKNSLVWWQVDPHYSHLWSTSCPDDPTWQPGEGRDPGWTVDYKARPIILASGISDARVPLFPRIAVHPVCRQVAHGEIMAMDDRWTSARGTVVISPDSFETGNRKRDSYARRALLETGKYPTIEFAIDSLVSVQPGDTIRAIAVGTFTLRGVKTPQRVPVIAWKDPASGGLRVQGRFMMAAGDLVHVYGMNAVALGLAVVMHRWKSFYMGLDLVLQEAGN